MSKSSHHFPDFHIMASLGLINGVSPLYKFGKNADIDTTTVPEDVLSLGGSKLFPTAASTISVVSDDANDTSAGTGLRNAVLEGLDANYDFLTETVTLAGLTPVVTSNSFLRVNRMYGTMSGSNINAVGTITATHSEGATASIPAGESQSAIACYTVPADHTLLVWGFFCALIKKASAAQADVHFEVRLFGETTFRVKQIISLVAQGSSDITRSSLPAYFPIPAKADIRVRVRDVTANDTGVVAAFDGYLIDHTEFSF